MRWGKPHDVILEEFTSRQLSELYAYTNIEPWGEERQDLRNAMLCTLMATYNEKGFDPKKDPGRFMIVKPEESEEDKEAKVREVKEKIEFYHSLDRNKGS